MLRRSPDSCLLGSCICGCSVDGALRLSLFVQYQEDASDIKDMSKYKPHILLSQENTRIRGLRQENRELWVSLEEHQEFIMSKNQK